jgi:hypothetical protein
LPLLHTVELVLHIAGRVGVTARPVRGAAVF